MKLLEVLTKIAKRTIPRRKRIAIRKLLEVPTSAAAALHAFFHQIFIREMPLQEFDNYDEYWTSRGDRGVMFRDKYIADNLPEAGTVIDVGCGNGTFLRYLKEKKPRLRPIGVDQSMVAIKAIKDIGAEGLQVDISSYSLSSTGLQGDYIILTEIIEHLQHPEKVMRDIFNIPAKLYFVSIPNMGYFVNRLRLCIGGRMPITNIIFHMSEHIRFWTVRDFKYWASHLGYDVVGISGQYGFPLLWKLFPSLFASGMVYMLKKKEPR